MLARPAEESHLSSKNWEGWALEPKHDGMRAVIVRTEEGVEIYSRTGKSQKGKCPHIEEAFMVFPVGTVLDGELVLATDTVDVAGRQVPVVNFNKTMRIMGSGAEKAVARQLEFGLVMFLLFDVIRYGDAWLDQKPQSFRFGIADSIKCNWLMHNPRYTEDFEAVYAALISAGVEGAILKDLNATYEGKRSKSWLKIKSEKTFDVVISGFTEGKGKYEGQVGAIEFSAYDDEGVLTYVGRCSGMDDPERAAFTGMRDAYALKGVPISEIQIVIEVKANELVGSGQYRTPRHPQYVTTRLDKNPEDCLMDQFKAE